MNRHGIKIALRIIAVILMIAAIFVLCNTLAGDNRDEPVPASSSDISLIIVSDEPTPTPAPTVTQAPTATATPKPTATSTPKSTATPTPKPTATATPKPTAVVQSGEKYIALTFDDGPYEPVTGRILDALEKVGGHATFFVVGNRTSTRWSVMQRADALGCQIGSHTYSHKNLTKLTAEQIRDEVSKSKTAIKSAIGKEPTVLRPPYGSVNDPVRENVDLPMVNWCVDTLDWKTKNAASTVAEIKKNAKDGSIILMHDLYEPTAEAVEIIVPWLTEQGYRLVTVDELAAIRGKTLEPGTVTRTLYK